MTLLGALNLILLGLTGLGLVMGCSDLFAAQWDHAWGWLCIGYSAFWLFRRIPIF